jgi:hypothetical protein
MGFCRCGQKLYLYCPIDFDCSFHQILPYIYDLTPRKPLHIVKTMENSRGKEKRKKEKALEKIC